MCTAINFKTEDSYFGRTLDLERSYGEEICILPRNFPLKFRKLGTLHHHYAIIGMAAVFSEEALFFDGANEHGLAMAGLNFPGNAHYGKTLLGKDNVCQFEFIPFVLGKCKNLEEARVLLEGINIIDEPFDAGLPPSPLHWIISHGSASLVVESMKDGIHIHENPVGVMTNNPPFEYQMFNLNNYRNLNVKNGENKFSEKLGLTEYCEGLGALGLPGDVSSMSRFVRAVFNKENSVCESSEESSLSQFFHILQSVEMCRGACVLQSGGYDISVYTSCINTSRGIYYYKTYDNSTVNAVCMEYAELESSRLLRYPLLKKAQFFHQNRP